ncbi:bifunctional polynucleotide phosphatase kinase [Raphidocelis subcapitata]|uniref:Bifunctional polynucleotide phosphatase kinase n=1 Tax=Raphidocelis subcapitata TaxID=307507 RepID=A0A2V0P4J9_9CHLO|nr:bifunctional polynucleotide phosphatase kinase [Raphidocelis subcapitata]|eukprot:GBF92780.1 bifunctional polynucleotide phosphatase kinase [Raphidocelis subcapitata]
MPPRKRGKKAESESEEPSSEFEPTESGSEESDHDSGDLSDDSGAAAGAKRKKPAAKKAPAPKKKPAPKKPAPKPAAAAPPKAVGTPVKAEAAAPAGAEAASPASAKKGTPRKAKAFAPDADDAWNYYVQEGEGTLIYRDFGSEPCEKIAAFDLDGTLVNVKSGAKWPKSADDWKPFNKHVAKKLQELSEEGYKIVIFSNQGGIKGALGGKAAANAKGRAEGLIEHLGVPAQVFLAPQDDSFRKPSTGMWTFMAGTCNGGVAPDLSASFYCGDAAGRQGNAAEGVMADFSDSDKEFAKAVGVQFKVPEDIFGKMEGKRAIDPNALAAARESLDLGEGPNAALLAELREYERACFDVAKATGDDKLRWAGVAMKKAVTSLATFGGVITLDNLKAVQQLPGVGKGTIEKIKAFLTDGAIPLPNAAEPAAAAAAAPSKRQQAAMAFI